MKKTIVVSLLVGPFLFHIIVCFIVFWFFSMNYSVSQSHKKIVPINGTDTEINTKDVGSHDDDNSFLLKKALEKSRMWYTMSINWTGIQYLAAIYPFALSAAILYLDHYSDMHEIQTSNEQTDQNDISRKSRKRNWFIMILSILSMTMAIAVQAINPVAHARRYRQAFVCIDNAINIYQIQDTKDEQILIDALYEGEVAINKIYDN